ncbi:RNA polymerase sigma factor [Larkinella sp. VNQ87]|uniref:RNA polymerase sigma factor n=1 Tax=Larkinella sp. VNQ87 TaxID=3400921 RepID=UPI003C117D42
MAYSAPEIPQSLWQGLKRRDSTSLSDLYRLTYHDLLNFGMYFGATATVAKDAINQVFAELWERGDHLPEVANVRSYLITALRRKLIKDFNRGERYTELTDLEVDSEPSYEELIVRTQEQEFLQKRLRKALDELTPRQRQLIELRFFRNKRNEEIAESTGMHINTVYNTLSSALKLLRQTLVPGTKEKTTIVHVWWLIFAIFGL